MEGAPQRSTELVSEPRHGTAQANAKALGRDGKGWEGMGMGM